MSNSGSTIGGEPLWIRCPGCSGQIGIPPDYPAEVVCCPKCAAVVRIDERMRVHWRPAGSSGSAASPSGPAQWIKCHGCDGEIGVPANWLGPTIACPKCGSIVAMRETSRVRWRPPEATDGEESITINIERAASRHAEGDWKQTAAVVLLVLGVIAFFSTAVVAGDGDLGVGIFAALLNPFVFIGIPLGLYWRRACSSIQGNRRRTGHRATVRSATAASGRPMPPAYGVAEGRQPESKPIRWLLHLGWFVVCFLAMHAIFIAMVASAKVRHVGLPFGIFAFWSCAFGAAIVVCWCVLLVKLIRHDRVFVAAAIFFGPAIMYGAVQASGGARHVTPAVIESVVVIDVLFAFLYGWGNAFCLEAKRLMLVWTYCILLWIGLFPVLLIHINAPSPVRLEPALQDREGGRRRNNEGDRRKENPAVDHDEIKRTLRRHFPYRYREE